MERGVITVLAMWRPIDAEGFDRDARPCNGIHPTFHRVFVEPPIRTGIVRRQGAAAL